MVRLLEGSMGRRRASTIASTGGRIVVSGRPICFGLQKIAGRLTVYSFFSSRCAPFEYLAEPATLGFDGWP